MNYSAEKGWRQTPEKKKRLLRFLRHDDPKDQIDEGTRKRREYGNQSVKDTDESRVPTEPFGQTATDAPDHSLGGEGKSHGWFIALP